MLGLGRLGREGDDHKGEREKGGEDSLEWSHNGIPFSFVGDFYG
jgi:hypothetical protein